MIPVAEKIELDLKLAKAARECGAGTAGFFHQYERRAL